MQKLMVSAVGKDQSGIVGAFTQVLMQHGCNIEDTSMTLLEDFFTMLFILQVPPTQSLEQLKTSLQSAAQPFELMLDFHTVDSQVETPGSSGVPWMISVIGPDQTGIMYHVTHYLGQQQVNIRHLSSKRLTRDDGQVLFLMALEVDVPETVLPETIAADLKQLGTENALEITAEPLEVYTL